jgi:hypothetical protein
MWLRRGEVVFLVRKGRNPAETSGSPLNLKGIPSRKILFDIVIYGKNRPEKGVLSLPSAFKSDTQGISS